MAYDIINNIKISGISCCVPNNKVDTHDYHEKMSEEEIIKFINSTGIKQTYKSKNRNMTTSDMCFEAAENLFKELNIDRKSIDALIFITQSSDYICPATACVLQYRLDLSNECIAYDINLGCSGYIYGLHLAATYLRSNTIKRVLLLCGETQFGIAPDDISSDMLFGEAGTATLLEKSDKSDMKFLLRTIGEGFRHIIRPDGGCRRRTGDNIYMNMSGTDVFTFTIKEVPKLFKDFYSEFNISNDDFDLCVLHQANKMIIDNIVRKIKMPSDKVPISLDLYGNPSSASIPITICDYIERNCIKNDSINIIASGYGIGLSLGVSSFCIDSKVCLPVIKSDNVWDDDL